MNEQDLQSRKAYRLTRQGHHSHLFSLCVFHRTKKPTTRVIDRVLARWILKRFAIKQVYLWISIRYMPSIRLIHGLGHVLVQSALNNWRDSIYYNADYILYIVFVIHHSVLLVVSSLHNRIQLGTLPQRVYLLNLNLIALNYYIIKVPFTGSFQLFSSEFFWQSYNKWNKRNRQHAPNPLLASQSAKEIV